MSSRTRQQPVIRPVAIVLVLVALQQHLVLAREQQLTWTQAAPLLQGHDVDVWLASNERLSGRVLATTAHSVDIDVRLRFEVGTKRRLPGGVMSIPSASLSLIKRRKSGDKILIGGTIALTVVAPMLQCAPNWVIGLVARVVPAAVGVWAASRKLVIRIVPDGLPPE